MNAAGSWRGVAAVLLGLWCLAASIASANAAVLRSVCYSGEK